MAETTEPQQQAEVLESTRSRSESGHAKNVANFDTRY
jgi:hypothetical protein